jgi:hypothetical protein
VTFKETPLPTIHRCFHLIAAVSTIIAVSAHADDAKYDEPGLYPGREYVHQNFGEQIDPFNGNLELHYVDVFIPGNGGLDLRVQRTYNSNLASDVTSPFGNGWNIQFGRVKHADPTCNFASSTPQNFSLELPNASPQTFFKASGAVLGTSSASDYITTELWKGQCTAGGMTVWAPNGTRYDMTIAEGAYWDVSKITDVNGNYLNFTYTTVGNRQVVSSISDGTNSRSISFTYSGGVLSSIAANGRTWLYSIPNTAGTNQLQSVQPPAGGMWTYDYYGTSASAGSQALHDLTYPQGGRVTYSYQFVNFMPGVTPVKQWTAVQSKTTSDGIWTFAYQVGSFYPNLDITTVTPPGGFGTIKYVHYGHLAVYDQHVWLTGQLYQKQIGSLQTETYTWTSVPISNETLNATGSTAKDTSIQRPVLQSKIVTRDGATFEADYAAFDSYGNPQTITETGNAGARQRAASYFANTSNWVINLPQNETTSTSGSTVQTITRDHYPTGNLKFETNDGVRTDYSYNPDGTLSTKTNARGYSTTYSSYYRNIPQVENRPEGVAINRSVDYFGNVTSQSDGVSTWVYTYDNLNRISGINYPTGNDTTIVWTDTSRALTRGQFSETLYYDVYGRPAYSIRSLIPGTYKKYGYDALGRKNFESLPGSSLGTTLALDDLGRNKTATSPDGTRTYSYPNSNVQVTNERGYTTTYAYARYSDPDVGYLNSIASPVAEASILISPDAVGRMRSVSQNGLTRTYGYTNGFVTSVTDPETGTTTLGRDEVGNLKSRIVGSVTALFTYDGLDRLKTADYAGPGGLGTFTYYDNSKLHTSTNSTANRTFTYDANGNLSHDQLIVDGNTFDILYGYDGNDALQSITYPLSKGVIQYGPDALGHPTEISPYLTDVEYFPSGNLLSLTFGNGIVQTYGEDSDRQLPNSITASAISLWLGYSYDGVGNVATITDHYTPSESRTPGYDGADRLNSISGPWGSGTITYDGAGNIKMQKFGSYELDYHYNATSNLLSSVSGSRGITYSYDGLGNIISNGTASFAYDANSEMTCAYCGAVNEIDYGYDGQGRRVWELKGGNKTYFVQSPTGDLQFEYRSYGMTWTKNVYLHGKRVASETGSDATVTTTSLSAAPATTNYGASVTLRASVSPSGTGTIEFRDGGALLGSVAISAGQASLAVSNLAVGTHQVIANYLGDGTHQASSSAPASVTVNKAISTATISASPMGGALGTQISLVATVAGQNPTGQVQFLDGSAVLATATLTSGSASFATSSFSAGSHNLTASYLGDANNAPSVSATTSLSISQGSAVATVTSSNLAITRGAMVTFTATVNGINGIPASGNVTFLDGATALATSALSGGGASYSTNALSPGSHSISVSYAGDSNYTAGTSPAITESVDSRTASSTTATVAARPFYSNQLIAVSTTVTGTSPTGNVHLDSDGTEVTAAALSSGTANLAAHLAPGTHSLQVLYDGDSNNVSSTSAAVSVSVRPGQQPQDFNADGKADLLWYRPSDRTAMSWEMSGATINLNSPSFGQGASGTELVGSGDFDGDGKADLLWYRASDGQYIIQITGGSQFNLGAAPAGTVLRGIGDFDGDLKSDLLWFNPTTRSATVWYISGTGVGSSSVINADGGAGYQAIAAADFDGDGKADVLWYRASDGMLAIQITGGATTQVGTTPAGLQLRTIGDVNGDGKADLIWYKAADATVTAWLMNGAQIGATQAYPAGAAAFDVVGAADFDGDGKADVLWYRPSDHMYAIEFTGGSPWTQIGTSDPGFRIRGLGDELAIGTPVPPMLIGPTGTVPTTTPTYSWNAATRSTWYYLLAQNASGTVVGESHTTTELGCGVGMGVGVCSWTPSTALANGGSYTWYAYAANGLGTSEWSNGLSINVNANPPATPTLVSPSGTVATTTPTYKWNASAGSTWYYLLVENASGASVVAESHTVSDLGCAAGTGTCSWTPTTALTNGSSYTWFVYAANASGTSAWSTGDSITVGTAAPPATPTLVSPSGTITTTTPAYTWNASAGSTWYELLVENASGASVISESHAVSDLGCATGTGTCAWTPTTALTNGSSYTWFVYAANAAGTSSWSAGDSITVGAASGPPATPTLVSPTGSVSTLTPTYVWHASAGATWYSLLVANSAGTTVVAENHNASDLGCGAGTGTCSWTPTTSLAHGGSYTWYVYAANAAGTSSWSAGSSITAQ